MIGEYSPHKVTGRPYAWVVTVDHIDTDAAGTRGPSGADPVLLDFVSRPGDHRARFKMYDDDGELYYEGWLTYDPKHAPEWISEAPLIDWGAAFAGCTRISYPKRPDLDCY